MADCGGIGKFHLGKPHLTEVRKFADLEQKFTTSQKEGVDDDE